MTAIDPFTSAAAWAEAIRTKRVSAREALEFHLARLEKYNPRLNAIIALNLEAARSRAAAADAATSRAESWGPLHGVPMTVKESFDVSGLPTTWGVPAHKNNVAKKDAAAVAGLQRHGAVIYGKTNVPVMLADWQSFNPIYGTTCNPWNVERAPGGSSGGAAAALAAGLTPLEIGSDIGASIRNPAHYCGVYGHKPSYRVVPQAGHAIPGAEIPLDVLVCGPMARSAEDLTLGLNAVAGPEPEDAPHWSLALPSPRLRRLAGVRIAVWLEDTNCKVDDRVKTLIVRAAECAAKAGATVNDRARPVRDASAAHALYMQILRAATGALLSDEIYRAQKQQAAALDSADDSYLSRTLRGGTQTHRAWYLAHQRRAILCREWAEFFTEFDFLLCPTAASAAFPHDQKTERPYRKIDVNGRKEDYNDQMFWAGLASLPYLPATVAPIGLTSSGLPVGVQIVGPYLRDHDTIELARLLTREIGGFRPPPGFE